MNIRLRPSLLFGYGNGSW